MKSPKVIARIAGSFYAAMFVLSLFAGWARSRIVDGSATTTVANIRDNELLYRASLAADLAEITCMLLGGMALYVLFKQVRPLVAAAMVVFVAVAVAVGSLNLLNQLTALAIATDDNFAHAWGQAESDRTVMQFTSMQHDGYYISAVYWGLWLLPLGYLVIRSRYLPRVIGALLILGGICYLIDLLTRFLAPEAGANIGGYLVAPGGIAELLLTIWLLTKAVRKSVDVDVLEPA